MLTSWKANSFTMRALSFSECVRWFSKKIMIYSLSKPTPIIEFFHNQLIYCSQNHGRNCIHDGWKISYQKTAPKCTLKFKVLNIKQHTWVLHSKKVVAHILYSVTMKTLHTTTHIHSTTTQNETQICKIFEVQRRNHLCPLFDCWIDPHGLSCDGVLFYPTTMIFWSIWLNLLDMFSIPRKW